jgi:hypothetical protein
LEDFLTKKKVDPLRANSFSISLRKKKRPEGGGYRYLVQYISPDGAICPSKNDVFSYIQLVEAKKNKKLKEQFIRNEERYSFFEQSSQRLSTIELPETFGEVTVLSWGVVDARPSFSTDTNMYPLGFCSRMVYAPMLKDDFDVNSRGSFLTGSLLKCEVLEGPATEPGGQVEALYRITRLRRKDQKPDEPDLHEVFEAPSEAEVWECFDPETVKKFQVAPSFFNLEVELLLEGMPGAIDQPAHYLFHKERGYLLRYRNAEEFSQFKAASFKPGGRTKRSAQRKNIVTTADRERALQERKDEQDREKEKKKNRAMADKERRERERDEVKRRKDAEKDARKESKERASGLVRHRQPFRRDAANEIKRARGEANTKVKSVM